MVLAAFEAVCNPIRIEWLNNKLEERALNHPTAIPSPFRDVFGLVCNSSSPYISALYEDTLTFSSSSMLPFFNPEIISSSPSLSPSSLSRQPGPGGKTCFVAVVGMTLDEPARPKRGRMIGTDRVVVVCRGRLGDSVSESEAVWVRLLKVSLVL